MMTATADNPVLMIARAVNFAALKHKGQRRKGEDAEPYINHLAEVAETLALHTNGANYLMCDGHAKFLLGSRVGAGYDALSTAWNNGNAAPSGQAYCGNSGSEIAPATDCTLVSVTFGFH